VELSKRDCMIGSKLVVRPTKVKNFLRKSYDSHNAVDAHGNYVMKHTTTEITAP